MEAELPPDEELLKGPTPILKHRSENRVTSDLKKEAIKGCGEQLQVCPNLHNMGKTYYVFHYRSDQAMHLVQVVSVLDVPPMFWQ